MLAFSISSIGGIVRVFKAAAFRRGGAEVGNEEAWTLSV
jgi:hypothetical protein